MSTESPLLFDLDAIADSALLPAMEAGEDGNRALVRLSGSVAVWDRLKILMPQLRASGVAVVLSLKKGTAEISEERLTEIFSCLKLWDQFTLQNLLELSGHWLLPQFFTPLQQESRLEMKWFEEWSTAAADTRLHKYPNLPWRRFIRKANDENYHFFTKLLTEWGVGSDDEEVRVGSVVAEFLKEKRKAVNIFPKRFNKKEKSQ